MDEVADDPGERMRLLMFGSLNHPHVEHLALAMQDRGFEVTVGGDILPNLPRSVLPESGIPIFVAPQQVRGSARGAAAHVRWIRRLLRELQPDVVHAHWLCGFACFAALAGAKPLVAMAWGSDVLRADRLKRAADRVALQPRDLRHGRLAGADRCDGRPRGAARERAADELGCRPRALPTAGRRSRRRTRWRSGCRRGGSILSPRSLMPLYNPRTIVDAFELLADELPDTHLVLKHMGTDRPPVGPLRYPDRVSIVGHVPYARMVDWYQASDVCVSIASSDSSPRSVWEAVASGTPCVVSDLPWVHELIEPGRDALVVPIAPEPVAAAIRTVLVDPALAEGLASNGRRLVEAHHNQAVEMDRVADSYRRLSATPA